MKVDEHFVSILFNEKSLDSGGKIFETPNTSAQTNSQEVVIPECLPDLLLRVGILHLPRHHGKEFREVDGSVTVGVDFVDHVLKLCLGRVLGGRGYAESKHLS